MPFLPLDDLYFDEAESQRKDVGDIDDLVQSINRIGLINAIIVERDGKIRAGRRRYLAHKQLGLTEIEVKLKDDLSELELHQLELDENIRRKDLTWQEYVNAVQSYHNLCVEAEGDGWTIPKTADRIGIDERRLRRFINVAAELENGNELVIKADKISTAIGIVERKAARAAASETLKAEETIDTFFDNTAEAKVKAKETRKEQLEIAVPLFNADFVEWAASYDGPKFNFLHCDFPYGIDADKHDQGAAGKFGGYKDDPDVYWNLLDTLAEAMNNVIDKSAHLIFWFSHNFYSETKTHLTNMGWAVNPTPLIWHKNDNKGILPDPRRYPRQIYEAAFLCSRGDRFLVRPKSNVYSGPNTKNIHMSEKPIAMLEHFMEMTVDNTTIMLDPTAGSGNAVQAAKTLGAKLFVGLEKNVEFHELACEEWRKRNDS